MYVKMRQVKKSKSTEGREIDSCVTYKIMTYDMAMSDELWLTAITVMLGATHMKNSRFYCWFDRNHDNNIRKNAVMRLMFWLTPLEAENKKRSWLYENVYNDL